MKINLLFLFTIINFFTFSQITLYTESFETGVSTITLNSSDMSGANSYNTWLVNNSFTGGSGNLMCAGFSLPFTIPNTTQQPAGIMNSPISNYLHIASNESVSDGLICSSFQVNDGICSFSETNFAKMNIDVSTIGVSDVTLDLWWMCNGNPGATFGEIYYSIDGGSNWLLVNSNMSGNSAWVNTSFTNPLWSNQASLRFAYRFTNASAAGAEPGFCLDDIKITAVCVNTFSNISPTACETYNSPSGKEFTSTAIYMDTIPNQAFCDSIITIDLTINIPTFYTDEVFSCGDYTWIDGNLYSDDNNIATYSVPGGNSVNCDSIMHLDLSVTRINDSVWIYSDWSLSAYQEDAHYQWLDCEKNMDVLEGDTNKLQYFNNVNNYAVEISMNGCVDTSECLLVVGEGIYSNPIFDEIKIYPNPSLEKIQIDLGDLKEIEILVFDLSGKLIFHENEINKTIYDLDLKSKKGIYILKLKSNNATEQYKIILK